MAREPDYDDDAPWLSSVEDERRGTTLVPQRRLIGGVVVFLVLLAVIVGGLYFVTARARQGGSSAGVATPEEAPLIAADSGPYKVAPGADAPTGLKVDGAGNTIYAAGEGENVTGALDPGAMPEDPLPRPGTLGAAPHDLLPPAAAGSSETSVIPPAGTKPAAAPPALKPAMATKPAEAAKPAPPPVTAPLRPLPKPEPVVPGAPAPKPATGGVALQLGAFSSSAKASAVWDDYAKRFKYLGGLSKSVQSVDRDGTTLYRLRAVGVADRAAAADLCGRLKVAGVECVVTQ